MGACLTIPAADAAVITIDPGTVGNVTATSDTLGRVDDNIVNESGLTSGAHDRTADNMWLSSGTDFGGIDPNPSVLFDLGAVYTINSFHVWNYNEAVLRASGSVRTNLTNRGVNGVSVEYGTTVALGSTVTEITNFAQANALATYAGENFNGFTSFNARYIKFDINSNHGDANSFYGLSEVQFDGIAIPEPSSAALLLGLGSIALVLRRRK